MFPRIGRLLRNGKISKAQSNNKSKKTETTRGVVPEMRGASRGEASVQPSKKKLLGKNCRFACQASRGVTGGGGDKEGVLFLGVTEAEGNSEARERGVREKRGGE